MSFGRKSWNLRSGRSLSSTTQLRTTRKSLCKTTRRASSQYVCLHYPHTRDITEDPPVQVLQDEPLEALQPTLEKLLADKDKNKQRGAAELLAGIIGGMFEPFALSHF